MHDRPYRSRAIGFAIAIILFANSPATLQAATNVWANSNVSGTPPTTLNWFNPTQGTWTGGTPVSTNDTTIQFFQDNTTFLTYTGGPTQTSVVDNAGSPFALGTLTLSGRGPSSSPTYLTMVIAGDPLQFSGATGTINANAAGGSHPGYLNYLISSDIRLGTASSATVLTIAATQNNNGYFRISGTISELQAGGGSIIKNGSGNLVLSGTNTFSGGVTINAGNVYASGTSTQVLGTGRLTLNGGVFSLHTSDGQSPANQVVGSIAGTGGSIRAGNRTLTFGTDNTSSTYLGSWDGGTFTKTGTGTTTVFNAGSTVSGLQGVNVNEGTLRLGASKNFGNVQVSISGTLDLDGFNSNGDIYNGGLYAGGALTTGSGIFTASGAGVFFHNAGTSTISGNLALGSGPRFRGDANATLIIDGVLSGGSGTIANDGNHQGSALIRLSGSSPNTFSGLWAVGNGTTELNKPAGVDAIPTDLTMSSGTLRWLQPDQIADTSVLTFSGGNLDLNGNNETVARLVVTNSGQFQPNSSATLTLGASSGDVISIGTGVNQTKKVGVNLVLSGAGGNIQFTADASQNRIMQIGSDTVGERSLGLGSVVRTVTVTDGPLAVDALITSQITGTGGITKDGAGVLQLSAANPFSGDTKVIGGTLNLNNNLALQNSAFDTSGGGALAFATGINTPTFGGLKGGSNVVLPANVTKLTLNVGTGKTHTYAGDLSGGTGLLLTKSGLGKQVLVGISSSSGQTTVGGGSLVIDGSLASTTVVVNAGASLGGSGTLAAVIKGAGSVGPGNSPGVLTVNQVDSSGGLDFDFELTSRGLAGYASLNDVLRMTNATPFTVALTAGNAVNLYVNLSNGVYGTNVVYGGFYADLGGDFSNRIASADYHVFLPSTTGPVTYNGVNYVEDAGHARLLSFTTVADTAFAPGGFVTEFTLFIVPEPVTLLLLGAGGLLLFRLRGPGRRRRN